jgi:hypothetical protein
VDLVMFLPCTISYIDCFFFFFASYSNEKSEARISEAPVEASSSSPSTDPPQVHKINSLAL